MSLAHNPMCPVYGHHCRTFYPGGCRQCICERLEALVHHASNNKGLMVTSRWSGLQARLSALPSGRPTPQGLSAVSAPGQ